MMNEAVLDTTAALHRSVVKDLFKLMDEDDGGFLDRGEIRQMAVLMGKNLSEKELWQAMSEMDEDGSGEVDFEEFYEWWMDEDKASASGKLLADNTGAAMFSIEVVPFD
eukprot:SAG22_NODE_104_length_20159_cov_5.877517_12_plen_109_part_00